MRYEFNPDPIIRDDASSDSIKTRKKEFETSQLRRKMMKFDKKYQLKKHGFLIGKNYEKHAIVFREKIKEIPIESKIFEFGCGLGQNIYLFENKTGLDLSDFTKNFCKNKGIKMVDSLEELEDSSYDVVLLSHVLEHLEDPYDILIKLKRILKKDGRIVIILPREKHNVCDLNPDYEDYHLYTWNFRSINNLLHRTGFKVLANEYLIATRLNIKLSFLYNINKKVYFFMTRLFGLWRINALKVIAKK